MVMAVGPSVLTYMQFHSSIDIPGLLETVKDIFVRVGHETTCASSVDKPFFTIACHCQTYQNYHQPQNCKILIFKVIFQC